MTDRPRKSMTVAQLVAWYCLHPPQEPTPLEPVVSDATTQVLPYAQWIKIKCQCCGKHGCSGLWHCKFAGQPDYELDMLMCAACALHDAWKKWTGFFSRHLLKVDLITTLTYPSRTEVKSEHVVNA